MKTSQMKTTNTAWAPPPNHLHRPREVNRKMVWILWSSTMAMLAVWLGLITLGLTFGGWVHLLLLVIALMAISTFMYGMGHDEYFERPQRPRQRRWLRRGRSSHSHIEAQEEK